MSVTIIPIVPVSCVLKDRAIRFGRKPNSLTAANTFSRVAGATISGRLNAREMVEMLTFNSLARSKSVIDGPHSGRAALRIQLPGFRLRRAGFFTERQRKQWHLAWR